MNLKFREGNSDDILKLRELAVVSYGQFEKILTTENWTKLYTNLAAESSYTDILKIAKCYVCEDENKIIGVAYIVPSGNPNDIFESNWSYIRMVAVHPMYSGNGIAKKLTQKCIAYARKSGESIVALHTSEFMDAARHLYGSLGFQIVKEVEQLFGKRYWLYHLNIKGNNESRQ